MQKATGLIPTAAPTALDCQPPGLHPRPFVGKPPTELRLVTPNGVACTRAAGGGTLERGGTSDTPSPPLTRPPNHPHDTCLPAGRHHVQVSQDLVLGPSFRHPTHVSAHLRGLSGEGAPPTTPASSTHGVEWGLGWGCGLYNCKSLCT